MTVVSALSPLSLTYFFYNDGRGLARPVRLFFTKPDTTNDPVTVYTNPDLSVPYVQPLVSGGSGRVPPIYIGADPYRVRIFDVHGELIEDIEFLPGATAPGSDGGGSGTPAAGTLLKTGDMFFAFARADTRRDGCVRANGGIIGPTTFNQGPYPGQVERLNDDTQVLFEWLWGQDPVEVSALAVLPNGRGSSASSDWGLNKGIRLPDLRARALVGLDDMGQGLTGRLDGVTVTPAVHKWSGGVGGVAILYQTQAQMPAHVHGIVGNYADIGISTNNADIGVSSANADITLNDPGHAHWYTPGVPPDRAATQSDGSDEALMTASGAEPQAGPGGPFDILTSREVSGTYLTQTPHLHAVTQNPHGHATTQNAHTHAMTPVGSGQAMQTITPFSLATVYIKL